MTHTQNIITKYIRNNLDQISQIKTWMRKDSMVFLGEGHAPLLWEARFTFEVNKKS